MWLVHSEWINSSRVAGVPIGWDAAFVPQSALYIDIPVASLYRLVYLLYCAVYLALPSARPPACLPNRN